jgi:hypothetical protein
MSKREDVLRILNGKTDEEKLRYISENFNLNWDFTQGPCKIWQAKVFTYCTTNEFEDKLDFFLFLVNLVGFLLGVCFQEEDTVFLGCVGPCGLKQTILYYSITFTD